MEPNGALHALRKLAASVLAVSDAGKVPDGMAAIVLAERVQALDEWLMVGGFLPADWSVTR